jgi:hypothetical protein
MFLSVLSSDRNYVQTKEAVVLKEIKPVYQVTCNECNEQYRLGILHCTYE